MSNGLIEYGIITELEVKRGVKNIRIIIQKDNDNKKVKINIDSF